VHELGLLLLLEAGRSIGRERRLAPGALLLLLLDTGRKEWRLVTGTLDGTSDNCVVLLLLLLEAGRSIGSVWRSVSRL
jgi:hypothetical protein